MTTCDHGEIYHSAENDNYYCKQCHAGMGHGVYSYISQLKNEAASEIEALTLERDALKIEYESRAIWIAKMMKVLDCENKDGFHCVDAHTVAEQLRARVSELEKDVAELLKHSFHPYGCPYPFNECTCGLGEIVKRHNTVMSVKKK